MESLNQTVRFGMVRRREDALNSPDFSELREQSRGELGTSVRGDDGRNSKVLDPSHDKTIYDRLGRNVDEWDCRWPASESVNEGKKVLMSI